MTKLEVTEIGAATAMILTEEVMSQLQLKKGDLFYLTKMANGDYRLTPCDSEFARRMDAAKKIMEDDREVLSALAK